jgi:SnoaL-like domain
MTSGGSVTDIERLVAVEEIGQLKARYFRAVDTKDWDLLASVFTDDAVIDFTEGGSPKLHAEIGTSTSSGPAQAVAWIQAATRGAVTVHQGYMPEIEVTSPTTATGIWAMADHLWYEEGSGSQYREIDAVGHYHERYVKVDGEWLISELRLTRLRSLETPW